MRLVQILTGIALVVLMAAPTEALPKRSTPGGVKPLQNNCSQSQLNSEVGRQCLAQADQDMMSGSSTYHYAYCSSSGAVLCCMTDGFSILDHSCTQMIE